MFSLVLLDMQLLTNKNVLACEQSGAVLILGLSGLLAASHKDFFKQRLQLLFNKTNKQKNQIRELRFGFNVCLNHSIMHIFISHKSMEVTHRSRKTSCM